MGSLLSTRAFAIEYTHVYSSSSPSAPPPTTRKRAFYIRHSTASASESAQKTQGPYGCPDPWTFGCYFTKKKELLTLKGFL